MTSQRQAIEARFIGTTGVKASALGFGGASVGNLYRASSNASAASAMQAAWDGGIRYFDTAPHYGHGLSEKRFGDFFGGKRPEGLVLSTKVGRVLEPSGPEGPPDHGFVDPLPFTQVFDYSYDGVMRSFEDSQKRLRGLPVDVLFMHDIGAATHGEKANERLFRLAMEEGFRAMAELRKAGDVRAIGLGVNEWEVCLEALSHSNPDVFMLAGRHTLLERTAERELFPECSKRGVSIIAAAPFNSGLLARRPTTASNYNYKTAPAHIVKAAKAMFDKAEEHGGTLQAAAIQFPLRNKVVASVVSGMSSGVRVESSLAWLNEPVSEDVWRGLDDVLRNETALC